MANLKARPPFFTVVDPRQAKERTCLKCSKVFHSIGPGNRICFNCDKENQSSSISQKRLDKGGVRYKIGTLSKGHS